MMFLTHLISGALTISLATGSSSPVLISMGMVASALPDIDISTSVTGRIFPFVSHWLMERFPHRGITHSVAAAIAAGVVVGMGFQLAGVENGYQIGYAFGMAYFFGGCFPDALTKSGVQLFWPASVWCVFPQNRDLRLKTGSVFEYFMLATLTAFTIGTFYINQIGGYDLLFNQAMAQNSGIEKLYNSKGSESIIIADFEGIRATNRQKVTGSFQIIQTHGEGFIAFDSTGIYKIGKEPDSQLIPNRVVGRVTSDASIKVSTTMLNDEPIGNYLSSIYEANKEAQIYLDGKLAIEDLEDVVVSQEASVFPTIIKSDSAVTLTAAPLETVYQLLQNQYGTGQLNARIIYVRQ